MTRNRILLVEDDTALRASLGDYLRENGYEVTAATNLAEARAAVKMDLIVLDWALPDGEGVAWLKQLRASGNETPVVLLTARADLIDKVLGLEMGANDYLTKPFEPRELVARIRVQLRGRSTAAPSTSVLESSGIRVDLDAMEVTYLGKPVALTKMELQLLKFFLDNPRRALSRESLLSEVWAAKAPTTRTVDVHVLQLRQKLDPDLFETLHGIGYRFAPREPVK